MPLVSLDVQAIPKVHSTDVSSLISDSGITRYRIEAKVWDMYSNGGDPYQYFPEKIYVEQFDSLFNVIGSIVADTAYYFERTQLWQAIGNVVVKNLEGRIFETSELFWDQKAPPDSMDAFYTKQLVKITNPDGTFLFGRNGFKANQSLNPVYLFLGSGEFIVEESTGSPREDTIQYDSIQHP